MRAIAARDANRTATGVPLPSPNSSVCPPAVVRRKLPFRMNRLKPARSNRSIGRLLELQPSFRSAYGDTGNPITSKSGGTGNAMLRHELPWPLRK